MELYVNQRSFLMQVFQAISNVFPAILRASPNSLDRDLGTTLHLAHR